MDSAFYETLLLTAKLATWTTVILLVIGFPMAYLLAYKRFFLKPLVEAFISMPLVLPPTVLGFYMLVAYSPQNAFGQFLEQAFDLRLAFSFEGVLLASVVFSLPFMIQPLQNGLTGIPSSFREASRSLGKSELTTFARVLVPNMLPSLLTAVAMTFAHCIGEFGVVIMVGGNMPGETRVASIAIYDEVQSLNYETANRYSFVLFMVSILILTLIYSINGKKKIL
ncbi:MAG: molybdate ABC transporter permease subunit [Bacteroidales bacterium]|nr:molybdate ABC transporter permease subunit [Bacteroidales bacterium]